MATIEEIAAADKLTDFLKRQGLLLTPKLKKKIKSAIEDPTISRKDIKDIIFSDMLKSTELSAPLMADFIRKSCLLDDQIELIFEKADIIGLSIEVDLIINEILEKGNLDAIKRAGPIITKTVLKQVDKTQKKYSPDDTAWIRHTNPGACKWCELQKIEFEFSNIFRRHRNCRCTKIRR